MNFSQNYRIKNDKFLYQNNKNFKNISESESDTPVLKSI